MAAVSPTGTIGFDLRFGKDRRSRGVYEGRDDYEILRSHRIARHYSGARRNYVLRVAAHQELVRSRPAGIDSFEIQAVFSPQLVVDGKPQRRVSARE